MTKCGFWDVEATVKPINRLHLKWTMLTYNYILLCKLTGHYTTMQPNILTPTTTVLGVENHGCGLYCRYF